MEFYNGLVYVLAYIGFFAASFYALNLFSYFGGKPKEDLMSTDKTVTIIIPAFNEEKSIERTIESALGINYPVEKLEIIVVDDGSKDRTYEFAKKYASNRNRNVKVLTKKNGGKGTAINMGIAHSRGEIIVSMDADSFVQPNSLKRMIAYFSNEKVMAVTPSMGVHKPRGILQRIQHIEYYMGVFLRKSFATMNAIHITPGAFSAYRKKFFDKYGGYDEHTITEDLEIALRIQSKHYIIENSSKSVVYTLSPNTFRSLLVQRKRWYTGLIKNFWRYRSLFGLKKGPLGSLVLPVAVSTVILSVVLTVYIVTRTLNELREELLSLQSVNFQFADAFEMNKYIIENFFYALLSSKIFLFGLSFLFLLGFYMFFSRREMKYHEGVKFNFFIFALLYGFLFAFWWLVSFLYILFNRDVVWREGKR